MNGTLIDQLTKAVAGLAEVVTDDAILTDRGHDFWGVGATAELLLRPRNRDEIAAIMRSPPNTASRSCPAVARRTARGG